MFPSPSPEFPSFRGRSEVRDCDLPWGWVEDSPLLPFFERWAFLPISLFCIHLSPLFSLGSTDRVQKELQYPVSSCILDSSNGSITAPQLRVSLCLRKNKKKWNFTNGNFTNHWVKNKCTNLMDITVPVNNLIMSIYETCVVVISFSISIRLFGFSIITGFRKDEVRPQKYSRQCMTVLSALISSGVLEMTTVPPPAPSASTLVPVRHVRWFRRVLWTLQKIDLHHTLLTRLLIPRPKAKCCWCLHLLLKRV